MVIFSIALAIIILAGFVLAIKYKYKSVKGYSVFSIFAFLFGLIVPIIFFGSGEASDVDIMFALFHLVLPIAIPLSIFFGALAFREIKKTGLKGAKLIIIGILLAIIPLIFFLWDYLAESTVELNDESRIEKVKAMSGSLEDEVNECKGVRMKKNYIICITNIAIKRKDSSICEKFIDTTDSAYNQNDCYEIIALELNDVSICGLIKDEEPSRNICYTRLAVKNNDLAICDLITRETIMPGISSSECSSYVKEDFIPSKF